MTCSSYLLILLQIWVNQKSETHSSIEFFLCKWDLLVLNWPEIWRTWWVYEEHVIQLAVLCGIIDKFLIDYKSRKFYTSVYLSLWICLSLCSYMITSLRSYFSCLSVLLVFLFSFLVKNRCRVSWYKWCVKFLVILRADMKNQLTGLTSKTVTNWTGVFSFFCIRFWKLDFLSTGPVFRYHSLKTGKNQAGPVVYIYVC